MNLLRPVLARLFRPGINRALISAGLAGTLLSGCVTYPVSSNLKSKNEPQLPVHQVADFLSTDCLDIWQLGGHEIDNNPLYWLRNMDCSLRIAPAQARAKARTWTGNTWQDTFKRAILLADAKINPVERRRNLTSLDAFSAEIPTQVRPLYQLWHDGQALQLRLSDERSRYSKLQESADAELDSLRMQQQTLRSQLDLTTRKLETLTDIERQLSSRKPGSNYMQDPDQDNKNTPAAEDASKPDTSNDSPATEDSTP